MKKIALLSIFALAVAAVPAFASNNLTSTDCDDCYINQIEARSTYNRIRLQKNATINSNYNLVFNTGNNNDVIADDLENSTDVTGPVLVTLNDTSDVNGATISDTDLGDGNDDDNNVVINDNDDILYNQVSNSNEADDIDLASNLNENFNVNAAIDTGNNNRIVGGDAGDHGDEGLSRTTGAIDFMVNRVWDRQVDFVTRNR